MSSGLSALMYSVTICEIVAQSRRFSLYLTWFVTTPRKLIEVRLFIGNWVMLLSLALTVRLKTPPGVFMEQVIIIYKIVSVLNSANQQTCRWCHVFLISLAFGKRMCGEHPKSWRHSNNHCPMKCRNISIVMKMSARLYECQLGVLKLSGTEWRIYASL